MSEIDKFIQAVEPCKHSAIIGMSLTAAEALALVAEIGELRTRAQAAEAEAVELRVRVTELRTALETVNATAQTLKPEVQQVRHGVLYLMRERNELEQQLATVTALVPSAKWLEMVATIGDDEGCNSCPYLGNCEGYCDNIGDKARELSTRIRAWRGDGDKEGGDDEQS